MITLSRLCVLGLTLSAALAHGFEALPDEEMSEALGQAGVSLFTSVNWTAQSIAITDLNGIPTTPVTGYANAGALTILSPYLQGCTNAGCTTFAPEALSVTLDAGGGGAASALYATVNWDPSVVKFRMGISGIGLQNSTGANAVEVIDFVQGYVDLIRPVGSPALLIELGRESTLANMMVLSAMNLGTLDFGQIRVRDKCDQTACGSGGTLNRNLRFNLAIGGNPYDAADAGLYSLDLSGSTINMTATGLVFSKATVSNLSLMMKDIIAGDTTMTMGTVGLRNITVNGLSVTISGKS